MYNLSPDRQREFAVEVVRTLRAAGFEAYWAGGCVRDRLLGRTPKDYDVATSATPPEISRVFARRKTLQVGAAFGVVVVVGGRTAGQIDVATFRHDVAYSDGRRPDQVVFSDPQQDSQRRDFTINGLFYDPLADQVIDFVGGEQDIRRRVVRAIGDPRARFEEDKLRMLRAVRFSATFGFELEEQTRAAVAAMAPQINIVSAERITQEMRAMLVHANRAQALESLLGLGLLAEILPEAPVGGDLWQRTLGLLESLSAPSFEVALAGLFWHVPDGARETHALVTEVARRWRLSNKELERIVWLVEHRDSLRAAQQLPWPRLQRLLIAPGIEELLALHEAAEVVVTVDASAKDDLMFCREQLRLPPEVLNPAPLLTGDDLLRHGVPSGPRFKLLLERVRDAQLDGEVTTNEEALRLVDRFLPSMPDE